MQEARCIFAIHNLSHQGVEPAATFPNLGLPDDWCVSGLELRGVTGRVSSCESFHCFAPVRLTKAVVCALVSKARLLWLP